MPKSGMLSIQFGDKSTMAGRLTRHYDRVLGALALLAGISIAVLAVLISADVVLRNLGIVNFPWLLEVSEYVLYGATFLAAPWVLHQGAHVRVDLLQLSLPGPVANAADRLADAIGAGLSAILMWYGGRISLDAFLRGDLLFKELVVPEWWLLVVLPISGALLLVEFLRRMLAGPAAEQRERLH